jgi:hypothetical protein
MTVLAKTSRNLTDRPKTKINNIWSWVPRGSETKNECADEDQRQITRPDPPENVYPEDARSRRKAKPPAPAGFLLGLLLDPDDKVTCSSETSVKFYQTTGPPLPENSSLWILRKERDMKLWSWFMTSSDGLLWVLWWTIICYINIEEFLN